MNVGTKLRKMFLGREVAIYVPQGTEERIRAYMHRQNADNTQAGDDDLIYGDDDGELRIAILTLLSRALATDEQEHGVRGTDWGEIVKDAQDAVEHANRFYEHND